MIGFLGLCSKASGYLAPETFPKTVRIGGASHSSLGWEGVWVLHKALVGRGEGDIFLWCLHRGFWSQVFSVLLGSIFSGHLSICGYSPVTNLVIKEKEKPRELTTILLLWS